MRCKGLLVTFLFISTSLFAQQIVPGTWSYRTGPNGQVSDPPVAGNSSYFAMANFDSSPYQEFRLHSGHETPSAENFKINFRLLEPNGYNKNDDKLYPIIIMLHGLGEAGIRGSARFEAYPKTDPRYLNNDNNLFNGGIQHLNAVNADPSSPYAFPGFVVAPQADVLWTEDDANSVIVMVEELLKKYKIDPNRVYIHGYSNGAEGVWNIVQLRPDLFAAMIVISWADYDVDPSLLVHIPIWHFQGELDTTPLASSSQYIERLLRDAGGTPRYTEYENAGHGIWDKAYAEPDFFSWLLDKNKTDIHAYYGKTRVCQGEDVNIRLGISPGFKAYQWKYISDGEETIFDAGTDNNEIIALKTGDYYVRFSRKQNPGSGDWTQWSKPLSITIQEPGYSPEITVHGSTALPSLDGKNNVVLSVPEGAVTYNWYRNGNQLTDAIYSGNAITVNQAGEYTVSVTEVDQCEAVESSPVTITVNAPQNIIEKPGSLTATAISENEIDLQWKDNAQNESGYEIYRSEGSKNSYQFIRITSPNSITFRDSLLESNTLYYYMIRGVNNEGTSPKSNEASARTLSDKTPPTTPGLLTSETLAPDRIRFLWGSSFDNERVVGYDIYVNGSKRFSTLDTTYVWSGITQGKSFTIQVKARDDSGNNSQFSNQITVYSVFNGLSYKYYYGGLWDKVADYSNWGVEKHGYIGNFSIDQEMNGGVRPDPQINYFAFDFEGYIYINQAGNYTFNVDAAAGSILTIDNKQVVDNDGNHPEQEMTGAQHLSKGAHFIKVQYYDRVQEEILTISYKGPDTGGNLMKIPDAALTSSLIEFEDPPLSPDSLQALNIEMTQLDLHWIDKSTNESGFELFRARKENGPFKKIVTTSKNSQAYNDKGLANHTTYFYQLKAVGNTGESEAINTRVTTNLNIPYFDASCTEQGVVLSWLAADQQSDKPFIIERAIDDGEFLTIGNVKPDTIVGDTLIWKDNISPSGTKSYRLKRKNSMNFFGYSTTVSTPCQTKDRGFSMDVFPVPANKGYITIAMHSKNTTQPFHVRIMDSTGRVFMERLVEGKLILVPLEVDISQFNRKGLYIIQVRQGSQSTARRFVVE